VPRFFFDTNAIIEAHRAGCWKTISSKLVIETVATCRAEALTGRARRPGYVAIDRAQLEERLVAHAVTQTVVAEALLACHVMNNMDEGEQELVAFVRSLRGTDWFLCGPDNALYRAMRSLGLLDRVISLEAVCTLAGVKKIQLRDNYTDNWHSRKKTQFMLDDCL
jgi:hypothetical protein